MRIPKKIKIGGHLYKIVFEKSSGFKENDCAKLDREKGIIFIDAEIIQSEKEVSLFHEIFHSINGEMEEKETDFLAQAIYQVLKDNHLLKS